MHVIHVTDAIAIDEREIEEHFVRASAGSQNVNKSRPPSSFASTSARHRSFQRRSGRTLAKIA